MSRLIVKPPTLWIVAGPNGSGKTTLYRELSAEEPAGSVWIINPDVLAATVQRDEGLEGASANLAAVERIEAWLYASVNAYQTVGVETVLSTDKYRKLVRAAKDRGFQVRMIFVYLPNPDANVQRVATRVRKGGHSVPEDKIRGRWTRSFAQFSWFLKEADVVDVFDNAGAEPRRVLSKRGSVIGLLETPFPALEQAINAAYPSDPDD